MATIASRVIPRQGSWTLMNPPKPKSPPWNHPSLLSVSQSQRKKGDIIDERGGFDLKTAPNNVEMERSTTAASCSATVSPPPPSPDLARHETGALMMSIVPTRDADGTADDGEGGPPPRSSFVKEFYGTASCGSNINIFGQRAMAEPSIVDATASDCFEKSQSSFAEAFYKSAGGVVDAGEEFRTDDDTTRSGRGQLVSGRTCSYGTNELGAMDDSIELPTCLCLLDEETDDPSSPEARNESSMELLLTVPTQPKNGTGGGEAFASPRSSFARSFLYGSETSETTNRVTPKRSNVVPSTRGNVRQGKSGKWNACSSCPDMGQPCDARSDSSRAMMYRSVDISDLEAHTRSPRAVHSDSSGGGRRTHAKKRESWIEDMLSTLQLEDDSEGRIQCRVEEILQETDGSSADEHHSYSEARAQSSALTTSRRSSSRGRGCESPSSNCFSGRASGRGSSPRRSPSPTPPATTDTGNVSDSPLPQSADGFSPILSDQCVDLYDRRR